jgi:cytochrome bd-type quinol oxidase subunit 2
MSDPKRSFDVNSPIWITPVALAVPPILLGLRALYMNEMPTVITTIPREARTGTPTSLSFWAFWGLVISFGLLLILGSIYSNLAATHTTISGNARDWTSLPLFVMIILFLGICFYWWIGSDPKNLVKLSALSIALCVTALITSQTQVNTQ